MAMYELKHSTGPWKKHKYVKKNLTKSGKYRYEYSNSVYQEYSSEDFPFNDFDSIKKYIQYDGKFYRIKNEPGKTTVPQAEVPFKYDGDEYNYLVRYNMAGTDRAQEAVINVTKGNEMSKEAFISYVTKNEKKELKHSSGPWKHHKYVAKKKLGEDGYRYYYDPVGEENIEAVPDYGNHDGKYILEDRQKDYKVSSYLGYPGSFQYLMERYKNQKYNENEILKRDIAKKTGHYNFYNYEGKNTKDKVYDEYSDARTDTHNLYRSTKTYEQAKADTQQIARQTMNISKELRAAKESTVESKVKSFIGQTIAKLSNVKIKDLFK